MSRYDAGRIEPKWQEAWDAAGLFRAVHDAHRPKFYVLEMFPYPSGRIHMGHVRNYTLGDVIARFKWARGFNVLHPCGWDAFGLPAENAAIEQGVPPADWTYRNIDAMRAQMKPLGFSIDWSREFATCDPEYYGQQQALFLDMLDGRPRHPQGGGGELGPGRHDRARQRAGDRRQGLALRRAGRAPRARPVVLHASPTWPRSCSTRSTGWRPGPRRCALMQRNWIGKSRGLQFGFETRGAPAGFEALEVYTTRPDTLWGASFAAISPEHPLAQALEGDPAVAAFLAECRRLGTSEEDLETAEKKGYDTGIRVVHPFDPSWELPVYIANFILMDYGTGAIFGCPAHDQRDLDFARKYGLPVIDVFAAPGSDARVEAEAYVPPRGETGRVPAPGGRRAADDRATRPSTPPSPSARRRGSGAGVTKFRLRDWGLSAASASGAARSRSSTAPTCGVVPEKRENLPVRLPDDATFDRPGNALDHHPTWAQTTCPHCGGPARRETDTMDTFVDSSLVLRPLHRAAGADADGRWPRPTTG